MNSGSIAYSATACWKHAVRRGDRARRRRMGEQQLEHTVHQRALGGVRARWLGEPLDAGEPESHRARRERLDPTGRKAGWHRIHAPIVEKGCAPVVDLTYAC